MKKTLLALAFAGFGFAVNAQEIVNENFDAYFPGNLGSDITGTTSSNGIFTLSTNGAAPTTSTNAANENFQIVENTAPHLNVMQLTGANGNKGGRIFWFENFQPLWGERDADKNIVEVEFDLYTGAAGGTSQNTLDLRVDGDAAGTQVLTGFTFNTKTLVLRGIAYYNAPAPGGLGSYIFYLGGGQNNVTLPANTWVRLGASFNKTTGQVYWKGYNGSTSLFNGQVMGAGAGMDPFEVNFISLTGTTTVAPVVTNTAASVLLLDNFKIKASSTDTLLAVDEVVISENAFAVYPNPASNVINVSNENYKITSVSISDLNGRIVKQSAFDNLSKVELNVSDLSSGVYMMNIKSAQGEVTKKIVKQ